MGWFLAKIFDTGNTFHFISEIVIEQVVNECDTIVAIVLTYNKVK